MPQTLTKFFFIISLFFSICVGSPHFDFLVNPEYTKDFWLVNAKNLVKEKLNEKINEIKAKNVILFLGDGMGFTTVAATRVALGGEGKKLAFENFPHTATAKTYCLDESVPDSACTSNSFLRGFKGNYGTIGLSGIAKRYNCADSSNPRLKTLSIAHWAQEAGKSTGFVTNTRVTHATTAGLYATVAERDWENNAIIAANSCDDKLIDDSAEQLIHGKTGSRFKVVFGGGLKNFVNNTQSAHDGPGARTDGKNLIDEWLSAKKSRKFIKTKSEMENLEADQVLGIFTRDRFPYHLDIVEQNLQEIPSLTEMTLKAIEILERNDDGFFLLVEGDRIDGAHHDNMAKYAVDETIEFNKAIEATMEKIDLSETLVVVTSDHSHSMAYGGNATRNHDIFGYYGEASDKMPYFMLSYANGPFHATHYKNGHRIDPQSLDISPFNFKFPAAVPLAVESHSGEDTGIWAIGPSSHLFRGTIEQSLVAHIMAYAACIGDGLKACDGESIED